MTETKIVSETEQFVYTEYTTLSHWYSETGSAKPKWITKKGKQRKYPCIGGPFDGSKKAHAQIDAGLYKAYNRAVNQGWHEEDKAPSMVWIAKELIGA